MAVYYLRRIGLFFLVLLIASTLNFFLPRISGSDPVRQRLIQEATQGGYVPQGFNQMIKSYDKQFGLDQPLIIQYRNYLWNIMHGNFGYSISQYPETVTHLIMQAIPWTLGVGLLATLLGFLIGSTLGAIIGWPGSPSAFKYLFLPLLSLSAVPQFLLGLVLLLLLAFTFHIFPLFGGYAIATQPDWGSLHFWLDVLHHAILPALSIVLVAIGLWALGMRGMMVNMQGEDYMIQAEAKGLKGSRIFLRYAIRNALLPQTTGLALALAHVVSGIVLVEVVFGYPGIGGVLLNAIQQSDFQLLQGIVFIVILAIGLATLVLDLAYPLLDPRIRYQRN